MAKHIKTPAKMWQNLCHKEAKTYAKRWQTCSKSLYCMLKNFFPAHQIICSAHQKNIICTAKIASSTFSHTLGLLLSFWHTFSYFPKLSQLLAHCAYLSKSEDNSAAVIKPV